MVRSITAVLVFLAVFSGLTASEALIEVRTESLKIAIDPRGATPVEWLIIDPRHKGESDIGPRGEPGINLLDESAGGRLRMLDVSIPGSPEETQFFRECLYTATVTEDGAGTTVVLGSPGSPRGVTLTRTYRFPRTGFETRLSLRWSEDPVAGAADAGAGGPRVSVGPGMGPVVRRDPGLAGSLYAYVEAVEIRDGEAVSHAPDVEEPEVELGTASGGIPWAGLHNRYFLVALLPGNPDGAGFAAGRALRTTSHAEGDEDNSKVMLEVDLGRIPGEGPRVDEVRIYSGPKIRAELEGVDPSLDTILFARVWDWLRWLCFGLLYLLRGLHEIVPSWGGSIILLAVLIRVVMSPVASSGLRAQARFNAANARMQPELKRIKEEFKGNAEKQHHETMRVYKEHGVSMFSPFKGCLWILIQLPIFIALFNVIGQAYELRGAGFLWMDDLAAPDRLFVLGFSIPFLGNAFNILPMIMAASQVLTTNLAPSHGADRSQQRSQRLSMWAMAAVFFVLFYNFPAGLVLYWTCANLGHLAQQAIIRRSDARHATAASPVQ